HERRVLRLDLVVAEVDDVRHPEDPLVELDPVVHASELDVPDDVVERLQADLLPLPVSRGRDEAGSEGAGVVAPVHERVHDLAVRRDYGELERAVLVFEPTRLGDAPGPALHRPPVRVGGTRDLQSDGAPAVTVAAGELRDLAVTAEPARQDEPDVPLLEHVRGAVTDAGLGTRVRGAGEAEGVLV